MMPNIPDSNDPYRPNPVEGELRSPQRFDNELQPDPALAVAPARGSRVAIYALGAAVLLGIVFYGLNQRSPTTTATSTAPATQGSAQKGPAPINDLADSNGKPAVPPGVRDVTPRANDAPGVTTGAAPTRPQSGQTGTEVDRSKNTN